MQTDSTIIYHKGILKDKKNLHASEMANKHLNLKKIQKLVVEMRGMMDQEKQYSSERKRNIKSKVKILSFYQIGSRKKRWNVLKKDKHDDLKYALIKEALKNKLKRKHTETLGENVEILHE